MVTAASWEQADRSRMVFVAAGWLIDPNQDAETAERQTRADEVRGGKEGEITLLHKHQCFGISSILCAGL